MSPGAANTTVFVAGGTLVGLALLNSKGPTDSSTYKRIWAAGLLTVGLGVAADFVPQIVGPFAVLVVIAAVLKSPNVIGKFLGGTTTSGGAATAAAQSTASGAAARPNQVH